MLDQLGPAERQRVASALEPIAVRMGVGTPEELRGAAAPLFWARFWQDRAFDFRPQVVRRLVKRLSERELSLRLNDVVQLDTFALPELITALGRVSCTWLSFSRASSLTSATSSAHTSHWRCGRR
jgi:hypothetical protein